MILEIKVIAKAKKDEIITDDKNNIIKIKTTAVPEKNKANQKIIKMLTKYFKTSTSQIKIIAGEKNNYKKIEIFEE